MEQKLLDVANYIIARCEGITNTKLQKLVYYSHAHFLITGGEPLIDSYFEAWVYGPVISDLHREFSKYSYKPIEVSVDGDESRLKSAEVVAIDYVLGLYGSLTPSELSDKVHIEDPWQDAYQSSDWSENVILNKDIVAYYSKNPLR
ncbi:MAG: DUF4065 domain-containing protein [Alphaproteobacteria bacterium]|jgi:uncharacterized phage-associated protein|nr:DUF4065 domain-containing protein [Alphaproteobacteria bacterium]